MKPQVKKDLPPKSPTAIKGGFKSDKSPGRS